MFESILDTSSTTISTGTSLLSISAALLLGLAIALCYMFTQRKGTYSKDFVIALVILPAIVAVVIMLIGNNVARAFSLAGAFALVRFRSAPGSAKDIAVVFFAMSIGLASGLGFVVFAVVFAIIMCVVLILLSFVPLGVSKSEQKQLKITIPEDLNYQGVFDDLFVEYATECKLNHVKTTNMGTLYELTYYIDLKNGVNEKELIDSIRCRNGNLNISLGMIPDRSGYTL